MKTKNEVKADFAYRGESLAKWAREHGYQRRTVYAVVNGELKLDVQVFKFFATGSLEKSSGSPVL